MLRPLANLDLDVLTDLVSNAAGMLMLLACLALWLRPLQTVPAATPTGVKPIAFPLTYVPPDKSAVILCLKFGRLHRIADAEREALEALADRAGRGDVVRNIEFRSAGLACQAEPLDTGAGIAFRYRVTTAGGTPLTDPPRVLADLASLEKRFPAERFFFVVYSWPECADRVRDILHWFHQAGREVGWMPQSADGAFWDVSYVVGEGSTDCTLYTAQ